MSNYLFIDDSGSKRWDIPYSRDFVDNSPAHTQQNRSFWQQNYFVLAGLHIDEKTIQELNPIINQKKIEIFGTKHVEFHSANLRNPHRKKKDYLDKYNITDEQLKDFINNFWYEIFNRYDIQLVSFIVDKRYFKNNRHEKTPLEIASETLFDRTELHPHNDCQIIFDQMDSQIKSTRRDQGKILNIANTKIDLNDGKYGQKYHHTSVSFEKSCNSNFLQLADTVAYNIWRQFVDHGDEWEKPVGKTLPMYPYFEKINKNFYHRSDNKVNGYGVVKIPDPSNKFRNWKIGE